MSSTQSTTNSPRLPIDITTLITTQEQGDAGNFISNSTPLQRIQLPNLALGATGPRQIKHRLRHAGLDQTGADGIDPDAGAGQLVRASLGHGDHSRLGSGVIGGPGVGAQTSDGGGTDNRAAGVRLGRGCDFHSGGSVFRSQEDTIRSARESHRQNIRRKSNVLPKSIHPHRIHKLVPINLRKQLGLPHNPGIREENVQPAVLGNRIVDNGRHGLLIRGVELPHVHVHARVERLHLALVRGQVGVVVVADVDCLGAVVGELVGAGAADAVGRVCSWTCVSVGASR